MNDDPISREQYDAFLRARFPDLSREEAHREFMRILSNMAMEFARAGRIMAAGYFRQAKPATAATNPQETRETRIDPDAYERCDVCELRVLGVNESGMCESCVEFDRDALQPDELGELPAGMD